MSHLAPRVQNERSTFTGKRNNNYEEKFKRNTIVHVLTRNCIQSLSDHEAHSALALSWLS